MCTPEVGTYTAVVLLNRTHVSTVEGADLHERANVAAAECGQEWEQETESEFLLACRRHMGRLRAEREAETETEVCS